MRDSSGRNWKPHFTAELALPPDSSDFDAGVGASVYAISVGTLSEVIPLPPGQVFMISISSGVPVYTAATLVLG